MGGTDVERWWALGGVVGPATFVGTWVVAGALAEGYSPIEQPISRLAAVGATTAPVMSVGFVAFGAGMVLYGQALRRRLGGPAWLAATASGLATIAVAATPLDRSATVDTAHAAFAGLGYLTVAATPLLAARPLRMRGEVALAHLGTAAGLVSATALALTAAGTVTGALQRFGLTVADAWIAASAVAMSAGRSGDDAAAQRRSTRSARSRSTGGHRTPP